MMSESDALDERPPAPIETGSPGGILLSIAYDGRPFCGFAAQPKHRTVAGELLGALVAIDPGIREVRGSSRTDSGVHARDQRVAFDPTRNLPPEAWVVLANRQLPKEIAVREAWAVPRRFQPRQTAKRKTYRYTLLLDKKRDPMWIGRAWRVPELAAPEKLAIVSRELEACLGEHDFSAFRGATDRRVNTIRTISKASAMRSDDVAPLMLIEVAGSGFMYNMVRIIVGTAVDVARRRKPPGTLARAIASHDRTDAGMTAPPDGLSLERTEILFPGSETEPPYLL